MPLRTRITVTFLVLLAAVLTAALGAVSVMNHRQAAIEVQHQLETGADFLSRSIDSNRRLLTLAADALAHDWAFRQALAVGDMDTLVSVLENTGERASAPMVVLTGLDGRVIAAYGSRAEPGAAFAPAGNLPLGGDGKANTIVVIESGRIYQLVGVAVKSPLPVARIFMGFELGPDAAREMADITRLGVSLSLESEGRRTQIYTTTGAAPLDAAKGLVKREIVLVDAPGARAVVTLTGSLDDAQAAFDRLRLTRVLIIIALAGLLISTAVILWLARNITRPLQSLTAAVDHIRAGSYDTPITVQRDDELGVLAEGLQVMQSAVQARDQSITRLAFEDTLTKLKNRAAFGAALTGTLTPGTSVAVAIINLHRFRQINELLGYGVGDAVLIEIAARLTQGAAAAVAVGRLAADEFVACSPLGEEHNALQSWGAGLLARLADPIVVEAQPIDISATIGLAVAPADGVTADELLRCADLAMERARREKRPLAVYDPSLQPQARDQLSLLGELQHAVDEDQLVLYFQPKMELATGRVAGAEVLLRWRHPSRGLLAPYAFIPFAEKTGFIRQLTRWTLEHAATRCARWHREGRPLALAVNISADDLSDQNFDQRVANTLARSGLPPGLLTLEITESGFIDDPERALRMLDSLATLGVHLSIDDFGTGYSSLSHLARMPVNELKIDRSFVVGLESDPEFAPVVRAAIDMGHSLGMKVVAEGIETEASAERLRNLKCDVGQGYLYAKPMPLAEFEAWLAQRPRVPMLATPAGLDDHTAKATVVA